MFEQCPCIDNDQRGSQLGEKLRIHHNENYGGLYPKIGVRVTSVVELDNLPDVFELLLGVSKSPIGRENGDSLSWRKTHSREKGEFVFPIPKNNW